MECIIALDVGGSSIKSALVGRNQRTDFTTRITRLDSRGTANDILSVLSSVIQTHQNDFENRAWECLGVGIGFPGPFDYIRGVAWLKGVDKFDALYGMNLLDPLISSANRDVRFGNDAVCAIRAEALYGAGRACSRVLGVSLGTGMGSAFVVAGKQAFEEAGIPDGGFLFAEPFAHARADDYFSTRGLKVRLSLGQGGATIEDAAAKARGSNDMQKRPFVEFGHDLGTFLRPYVATFKAETVLVLGGIALAADLFSASLQQELAVPVRIGELGAKAGVLGASLLFD